MDQSLAFGTKQRRGAAWLAVVAVGAWLLHPILTSPHVEGFSASLVSLALHINTGQIADYDRLHPANLEYFTLSRLGIVSWMSMLTGPLGVSGEWAMRVTTWIGFVALATSSFVLTRRWANASSVACVVALLLIPGLAESSFFYNDTIFSAALGVTSLAVIRTSPSAAAAATSGVLFGAAIVARLDAVLLAPAVMLIGYDQHGLGQAFWSRALVFTIAALVPIVLVPAALGANILDVVAVTSHAIILWDAFRPAQHARELSLFLGIPAAVLVALGCLGLVRRRDYLRLLLLVGVPALFNVVAFGKILQARQLLPLTPFLATLLILGWQHVSSAPPGRDGTALKRTVLVVCCLVLVSPMLVVRVSDGPRAPYGRLWTPVLWSRWQQAANANQAEIRALVRNPRRDSTAFVTDTWDGDRYLHLALQETGYHLVHHSETSGPCSKTAEEFARGDRRVLHIRLHQPFLPNWRALASLRLETWGMPCLARWKLERVVQLAPLEQLAWSKADRVRGDLASARQRALEQIANARYSPQLAIEVRASDLSSLRDAYRRQASWADSLFLNQRQPAMSLQEAERLMAARAWMPRFRNTMRERLLVFIPCYNCERQIGRVLRQFSSVPLGTFHEILVLDNRSSDGTLGVAIDAVSKLNGFLFTVARNRENYNLGGSHKAAFAYAEARGFTHVVVLHGDDQGRIQDVLPLLASGAHRDHDACLGARFMAGSKIEGYSYLRRIGNRVFNLMFSIALRRRVADLGSGLNVFSRAVFPPEVTTHLPDDLHFNPYLLVTMVDRGMRIAFFPISWREEDQVSNVRMASQALKTLGAAREYLTNRRFLREGEHRKIPRTEYTFDVLASREPTPPGAVGR